MGSSPGRFGFAARPQAGFFPSLILSLRTWEMWQDLMTPSVLRDFCHLYNDSGSALLHERSPPRSAGFIWLQTREASLPRWVGRWLVWRRETLCSRNSSCRWRSGSGRQDWTQKSDQGRESVNCGQQAGLVQAASVV